MKPPHPAATWNKEGEPTNLIAAAEDAKLWLYAMRPYINNTEGAKKHQAALDALQTQIDKQPA